MWGAAAQSASVGPYARVDSGWSWSQGSGDEVGDAPGESYIAGAGVGYRFNSWLRADLVASYRGGFRLDTTGTIGGQPGTAARADASSLAAIAAVYIDLVEIGFVTPWGKYGSLTPYLGAGTGIARNALDDVRLRNGAGGGSLAAESETSFTWQVSAGIGVQVLRGFTIDIGYRYADLGRITSGSGALAGAPVARGAVSGDFRAHEAQLGIRYGF